jgi:nitroimidazol reductase NimA-like FMN-containing flavoprotein (pyridoxamine 5'-phosphate oxidase superfamily)
MRVSEDGRFFLSLGNSRRHLRNVARDPLVTLCVDDDPRMTDLTKSPRSVVCFGLAKLVDDDQTVRDMTKKMELRYLGEAGGPELDELLWFEGRTVVEITPVRWLAWDQGKG